MLGLSVAARDAPPIWAARQKAKQGGYAVISVILNGDPRQVREGSIADLVASLGLDVKKVAVERNREIVPRSTLADVALAEGDALEIVHFVGGGC
jgi:thiamine biosynthesis protein ThiS